MPATANPRNLSPAELARIVNRAGGRELLDARRIRSLSRAAPQRLGPGRSVDLVRFAAYLLHAREQGIPLFKTGADGVQLAGVSERDRQNVLMRKKRAGARDIGDIPAPVDPARRESCRLDLELFCTTYFPESFPWEFSVHHKRILRRIQQAVLEGGRFVEAVFRGFGKTTIAESAVLWAVIYNHHPFAVIIAADADAATINLDSIRAELEENDWLHADFPEVCHPIRALEGIHNRCAGQTYEGKRTHIEWRGDTIVLPMVEGSPASGAMIGCRGIKGRIRGWKKKRRDGVQMRPTFAIVEDPQNDESAISEAEIEKRLRVLTKAVLKLAGHDQPIACVVPATVIAENDMIDRLLDHERFPSWQGERVPLMESPADNENLWLEDYARIRNDYDPDDPDDPKRARAEATRFYRKHRAEMDAGCVIAWDECYDHDAELSAIQHAYNSLIDDGPDVFASEMQQRPRTDLDQAILRVNAVSVATRTNGLDRLAVPEPSQTATLGIDVGHGKLHWACIAWSGDFSGDVVAYGEWPAGRALLYDHQTGSGLCQDGPPVACTLDAAVRWSLAKCIEDVLSLPLAKPDGRRVPVDRAGVDCGDPGTRPAVFSVCGQSKRFSCRVEASRGRAHKKFRMPKGHKVRTYLDSYRDYWKGSGYVLVHDACVWRERLQNALIVPPDAAGALRIWGGSQARHDEIAAHMAAEPLLEKLHGDTGEHYVWQDPPLGPQHYQDAAVIAAVLAGVEGLRYGTGSARPRDKTVSFAEKLRRKREKTGR